MPAGTMSAPDESEILAAIARSLANSGSELAEPLRLLAEGAMTLLGVDGASVGRIRGSDFHIAAAVGALAHWEGAVVPVGPSLALRAIEAQRVLVSEDAAGDPRTDRQLESEPGLRELAVAPMLVNGEPVGTLVAANMRRRGISPREADLLQRLADHAALAIRNSDVYERADQSLRESRAFAEISRLALDASSQAGGAEDILEVVDRLFPSSGKALAVVDDDGASLRYIAGRGSGGDLLGARVPVPSSMGSDATRRGVPLVFPSACEGGDPSLADWVPDEPMAIIALFDRQRLIGALAYVAADAAGIADGRLAELARIAAPVALALDVLVLREREARQRERERMLAAALTTMDQPVLITATGGRVLYANAAALRQFGYSREELTGMSLEQLAASPVASDEQAELFYSLGETGVWSVERAQRRKDGSEFPATMTWSVIEKEDRGTLGLVVHVQDLTEERRMAEQLRQTEKLAAIGELVAGVAHEVNNPLTGISAFAQLLLEQDMSGDVHESVRLIKRESDRAAAVIRDLLLFARNGQARTSLVDLNAVIEQTLRLRGYSLRSLDVDVRTELAPELAMVQADPQRLQQVLINLLVNAEHAMQHAPVRRLSIRTQDEEGRVIVEIADSGIGMPADVLPHVFEPFFTTKHDGAGTGLGLSVSYGIIQSHRGNISVESAPGAGTVFRISLPAEPGGANHSTGLHA